MAEVTVGEDVSAKDVQLRDLPGHERKEIPSPIVRYTSNLRNSKSVENLFREDTRSYLADKEDTYLYAILLQKDGETIPIFADCNWHPDLVRMVQQEFGVTEEEAREYTGQIRLTGGKDKRKVSDVWFRAPNSTSIDELRRKIGTVFQNISPELLQNDITHVKITGLHGDLFYSKKSSKVF